MRLSIPRARAGTFEPRLAPKGTHHLGGLDEIIVSRYAGGMTIRDIQAHPAPRWAPSTSPDTTATSPTGT